MLFCIHHTNIEAQTLSEVKTEQLSRIKRWQRHGHSLYALRNNEKVISNERPTMERISVKEIDKQISMDYKDIDKVARFASPKSNKHKFDVDPRCFADLIGGNSVSGSAPEPVGGGSPGTIYGGICCFGKLLEPFYKLIIFMFLSLLYVSY